MIMQCRDAGLQAIELDNLDVFDRSDAVSKDDASAVLRLFCRGTALTRGRAWLALLDTSRHE